MQTQEHLQEHELGNLLRYWRRRRGKSQLDLSLDTGISQRHLSFVESGRSVPSRDLLLLASGYAPSTKNPRGTVIVAAFLLRSKAA
jgi:transcriptional regulator with XRE-family HTH domain